MARVCTVTVENFKTQTVRLLYFIVYKYHFAVIVENKYEVLKILI